MQLRIFRQHSQRTYSRYSIWALLFTLLCLPGYSQSQELPDLSQLQAYDRIVNTLQSGNIAKLGDLTEASIDNPFALAQLLLDNQRPRLALNLLEDLDTIYAQSDPRLTLLHQLRAEAWSQLGDEKKTRTNQLSALQSLRVRLGYQHPTYLRAINDFIEQWQNNATIDESQLRALAEWLREPDNSDITSGLIAETPPAEVPVWFGTNRSATGSADPANFYDAALGDLALGRLTVSIPPNHKRSVLERPSFWEISNREDPMKHVVLADIVPLSIEDFSEQCCSDEDKLLFIHGYNVSFHDGALRAGQIAYDLEFPGSVLYYSWPSQGSLWGYLSDANNVVPSRPALIRFLDIATRSSGKLHIVAHSMGNRYLMEALEIFVRDFPDRSLGKIIFAAPDVDQVEFVIRLQSLRDRVDGLTLYGATDDQALKLSRTVNGRPRAGDSGRLLLKADGLTSIDATGIAEDSLGHSYFGDADLVLADIMGAVRLNWPPTRRCSLTSIDERRWRIAKEGCRVGPLLTATRLVQELGTQQAAISQATTKQANQTDAELSRFWSEVLELLDSLQLD